MVRQATNRRLLLYNTNHSKNVNNNIQLEANMRRSNQQFTLQNGLLLPKSTSFPTRQIKQVHNLSYRSQVFYNIESKVSNRATSFGYGTKCDFTKDVPQSPPPNSYNLPTDFSSPQKVKKGFCFGQGRSQMIITGPLAQTINNKNPGPGSYQPLKKTSKISYSLRGKVKQPQPEAQKIPGPGAYKQNNFFTQDGANFNSKHCNHKAIRFNSGGERFKRKDNTIPGPGNYNTSTVQFSSVGKYSLSNLQNSKVRSFGQAVRKTFANRCQTPGPGNYTLPSQFGYYVSKKEYDRTHSASKSQHKQIQMTSP